MQRFYFTIQKFKKLRDATLQFKNISSMFLSRSLPCLTVISVDITAQPGTTLVCATRSSYLLRQVSKLLLCSFSVTLPLGLHSSPTCTVSPKSTGTVKPIHLFQLQTKNIWVLHQKILDKKTFKLFTSATQFHKRQHHLSEPTQFCGEC